MADAELKGKTIAIVAADQVEEAELVAPRRSLEDAGAETHLISMEAGEVGRSNGMSPQELSPPDPASYRRSTQTARKSRQAREARKQVPLVWFVVAGTIALVFVIGFLLAFLL